MHTRGREGQIFGLFKRMYFIDNPIAQTLYPLDRSDKSIKFSFDWHDTQTVDFDL